MGLGLGLGIQFNSLGGMVSKILTWGKSIPARFWGTTTPEYWGGLDAQAEVHYNRVIADGGVVPAGLGGVNSFFQVVKGVYGTSDINTAISAAYDPHYLGYRLGAGSGTTLGQAARTLYSVKGIFGGIGTGSAFWEGVNVGQNNVVTPDAPANRITGDVDIICYLLHTSNGGFNSIVSKNDGGTNRAYNLTVQTNTPTFYYGAATLNTATATANITSGSSLWLRVTRNATNGEIRFFTSNDASTTNPQSVTWTQLGATVSGVTGSLNSSGTLPLIIGGYISTGSGFTSSERIFRLTIANSIGGAPVVDFNANQYTGANTWTSTTGEVWTVNSTGAGLADVTQTTATSQPLLLEHTGENYYFSVQAVGNSVSSSTSYATSNIDVEFSVNNQISSDSTPVSGGSGGNPWRVVFNSGASAIQLEYYSGGYRVASASTTLTGNNTWRVTRNSTTGAISFIRNGVTLTTTGSQVSGALDSFPTSLFVGNLGSGANGLQGRINWVKFYISNVVTRDFNPSSYNPATSQTQWTSATGEVWTINTGTATTGYKGVLVDRTYTQTDGIDDGLINTLSGSGIKTQYFTHKAFSGNSMPLGLWNVATFAQAFYYPTSTSYGFYQGGAQDGPFGVNVIATPRLRISGAVGGTGTDWIPFQNGVDVSNGGANIGSVNTFNSLRIGVRGNNTGYSNGQYTSYIVTNQGDNATQRTAIQTYLNSITKCY